MKTNPSIEGEGRSSMAHDSAFGGPLQYIKIEHDIDENEKKTGVVIVKLSNEARLNALTMDMAKEFERSMKGLRQLKTVRCMILTGDNSVFSAGGDLDWLLERTKHTVPENQATMLRFYKKFLSMHHLDVPIIAAVNGHCVGAGCCLTLAADIRLMSADPSLKFGVNFSKLGIPPGMASTFFLPRSTSPQMATKMLLTGSYLTPAECERHNLVLSLHEPSELMVEALKLARSISNNSKNTINAVITSVRESFDNPARTLSEHLYSEAETQANAFHTKEYLEGVTAMKEKRTPQFDK